MSSHKEFKPTSWSIDNKTSIYILTLIIGIVGVISYIKLPKEKFPDIVIPTIYVQTIYPGSSPKDIENLITKPLEKKIKSISGVKKLKSQSIQDFSIITVEFGTNVKVDQAKQKVKDEVDKAKSDLPSDLKNDPYIMEVNFNDLPILYVNISGDYDLQTLKKYSEVAKDKFESLREITRVDMVGAKDREIQINLDIAAMTAAGLSIDDISRAVQYENMQISGGNVTVDRMNRSLSVNGQFKSAEEIANLAIRSSAGATVYLRDVADVKDGFKETESYARLNGKNVITLNVVKRAGENLIDASDKCRAIIAELQATKAFPDNLEVKFTGDQSNDTRITLHDLINTIIIGFVLVTVILMFFMGATNAFFVAMSVPLSCFVAFLVFPTLGFSLNMIVLFAFLLALGIVVDDAIVVIENTHRIFKNGKVPIKIAAKQAAGEVFLPVLSGTLTTLAPFIPLAFWQGIIGKFMFFLPVTLIITLLASLVVAYIINPVFAVDFMKPHHDAPPGRKKISKGFKRTAIIMGVLAFLFYIGKNFGMGNFTLFLFGCYVLHYFVLEKIIKKFQEKTWPRVQDRYSNLVKKLLVGRRPLWLLLGTVGLFIVSIIAIAIRKPAVEFFPNAEPNFTYIYLTLPVGTNAQYTDSTIKKIEKKVFDIVGPQNPLVESVISNVAVGANDPSSGDQSVKSNKAKITIAFVQFAKRNGASTADLLEKIRTEIPNLPGAEIIVEKERNGPPVGKAINIEIRGDEFDDLIKNAKNLKVALDNKKIDGVEELKSDFVSSKPEILIKIDRERANREGISTAQVGMALRNAIYGAEPSKFKDANDDYPIMVRVKKEQANDLEMLNNMQLTFRDMNMGGMLRKVPISSVAEISYTSSYGGINRLNQKRVVTLQSNVLPGFAPNEVVANIQNGISEFQKKGNVEIVMTGEQEEQAETGAFLGMAMLISIGLIVVIMVTQFNSISKPLIILTEILFSIIGVFLGVAIFGMSLSIVMTGIGVVALAGIVVRNGILMVEFIELLRGKGVPLMDAIILAGRTRMTPVLLTATATISGLIPLAVGLNIDFVTLFTHLNPHIFFGGDSVAFWGPLSWTMIFGLSFATLLTLLLVPAMYLMNEKLKIFIYNKLMKRNYNPDAGVQPNWEQLVESEF